MRAEIDGIRRTRCPLCGGDIIVSDLYQVSHDHKLTKSGRVSEKASVAQKDEGTRPGRF